MSSRIGMTRTALSILTLLTTICGSTAVLAQGPATESGSPPPATSGGAPTGASTASAPAPAADAAKAAPAASPPAEAIKRDKPSPAELKQAKRDLADANKLLKKSQCDEALPKLESAYSVEPKPATLRSIAQCQRDLKRNVAAFESYEKLANLPAKQLAGKDRTAVEKSLAELREQTGTIRITTTAQGPVIKLDDKAIAPDKLGQAVRVELGKHKVSATASGFEPFESEVIIEGGKDAVVDMQFRPEIKTGHVKIAEAHATAGVHVLIDGKDVGAAPWEGDLDPGQHTVALAGPNLTSETQTVGVAAKAEVDVLIAAVALPPPPPVKGRFHVTATPSEAVILIDGKPGAEGELEAGTHRLDVSAPGYVPVTREFVVAADKPAIENVSLERDIPALRVGLLVGLLSLPRPIKGEVMIKLYDVVGIGGEFSMIPDIVFPGKDAKVQMNAIQGVLRWFPFRGAFYLGAGLGVQNFKASLNTTLDPTVGDLAVSTDLSALFISPQLGWIWTFGSGFTLGLNAGVQIPFANDPTIDTKIAGIKLSDFPDNAVTHGYVTTAKDDENKVRDVAKIISNTPLPNIDLLKIGFFF